MEGEENAWPVYKRNARYNKQRESLGMVKEIRPGVETEVLMCAAREQAFGANDVTNTIDKTVSSGYVECVVKRVETFYILFANVRN